MLTLNSLPTHITLASCDGAEGEWLRPQAGTALTKAAQEGDLATLKRLVAEGVNLEATTNVSAAPPPSPSARAVRRPCCPALRAAAHGVWRRRRASAVR